ncbi:MAG: HPP family protein [Haloferacaceae archaeon]
MFDRLAARAAALLRRVRRVERREAAAFRRWVEDTDNLLHLTVTLAVPLLIGLVTYVSRSVGVIPFLLFPPLAAGTYTLFADPEGRYSSPRRFVGGLTAGAASGWVALEIAARVVHGTPPPEFAVHAPSAALAVFLTAVVTWALGLELPTAFSTALLVLTTGAGRLVYVVGMMLSASLVAAAFVVWRDRFYERRAQYLYGAVRGDDHVLVPVPGGTRDARPTVTLAARLAAAHEAGKVVLLDVVDDERIAAAERALLAERESSVEAVADAPEPNRRPAAGIEGGDGSEGGNEGEDRDGERVAESGADAGADTRDLATRRAADEAAARLEREAEHVREATADDRPRASVPCEVVVATGDPVEAMLATAEEAGCDLVVTSLGPDDGDVSPLVRGAFDADVDAAALRSRTGQESWRNVLVMVARQGDVAHAMADFATRLAGDAGHVALCSCIDREVERRRAEDRLADVAETTSGEVETRVSRSDVEAFVDAAAPNYDLVVLGSSRDRSRASRLVTPPTYRRVVGLDVDCDVLVVD